MIRTFIAVALCQFAITGRAQDRLWLRPDRLLITNRSATRCQAEPTPKAEAEPLVRKTVYPILSLNPEGRLRSGKASDFYSSSGATIESVTEKESWMPTAHVGMGFAAGIMDLEFLVGGGSILNEDFRAGFGELLLAPYLHLGKGFKIGPYIGFMTVEDADWRHDSKVRLEGGGGTRSGLALAVGNETSWFTVGAAYLDFSFDAAVKDGWDPSRKELDLSGWVFHMGVTFTF